MDQLLVDLLVANVQLLEADVAELRKLIARRDAPKAAGQLELLRRHAEVFAGTLNAAASCER